MITPVERTGVSEGMFHVPLSEISNMQDDVPEMSNISETLSDEPHHLHDLLTENKLNCNVSLQNKVVTKKKKGKKFYSINHLLIYSST